MKETFLCQVIILFATPLIVMCNAYDKCGAVNKNDGHFAISDIRTDDIYAPWLASVGKFVSVDKVDVYKVICSGSVLTPRILATAAHCFHLLSWQTKEDRPSHIRVGGNRRDNKYVETRKIQEFRRHPNFTFPEFYFDVALIILDEELIFSQHISPICLPQSVSSYAGENNNFLIAQGWGKDDEGETGQSASEVSLGIKSIGECTYRFNNPGAIYRNQVNAYMPELIKDNILFCAESDLNSDLGTCHADSGGPAIQK